MGNKKSKKAEIRQLTEEEIQSILENTEYTREQISEFHQNFTKVYPSGILQKDEFCKLYNQLHPTKKSDKYLKQIFQMFDADKDGVVTFGEFMITVFLQGRKQPEEKLRLVFRMYDHNCNGFIEKTEIEAILHSIADNCNQIEYDELVDWDENHSGVFSSDWNYQSNGPDFWTHEYPQCKGSLQSPINIKHSDAIYDSNLGQVMFHNYDKKINWNFTNTVIANQISNESLTPYITGSDFEPDVKYFLKQFHFHWGFNIFQGSEHQIDSAKFPLEIHLVHMSDLNETAVLSFLFQIALEKNQKLDNLIKEISQDVAIEDSHIVSMSLEDIIPDREALDRDGFYRYLGSLTTPPCTEGVKWTIFRSKINISQLQMMEFYKNEIDFNYRESQELNDRILTISVQNAKLIDNNIINLKTYIKQKLKNLLTVINELIDLLN